uniref:Activating transcription factor 7-interacting protein 2 n=1 Tax=Schistosoma haematobium TaxID=6185 RepID=A0A095CGC0_SCHHA
MYKTKRIFCFLIKSNSFLIHKSRNCQIRFNKYNYNNRRVKNKVCPDIYAFFLDLHSFVFFHLIVGLIYLCLSGLFVMSDLSCNADVTDSFNITQNTPISNSNCTLLNDVIVENHNDCDPCTQGPSVKKPRLFEQQDTVCKLNNGFKDGYNICNLKSLPEIQEELKKVRLCFDSKLKLALKEKLSKYISFIETTEKTVTSLKEEITQLTGRMDFIESSSKDLTKLINERIPLPAPTSGIGQSRTLSSQAPRLPVLSHSPSVSAPDRSIQTVNPSNRQTNLTPSNSVSSRLLSVLPKTFELQCVPPQTASGTVLAIQVNDTIDLTSDTNIENAWEEHLVSGSTNTKKINKHSATPLSSMHKRVCLQWSITYPIGSFEPAISYEIYSYASSEVNLVTVQTSLPWKKVGEVAALPLPMACTLTHVQANNMYYFVVRSVDRLRRYSSWSNVVNAYVS